MRVRGTTITDIVILVVDAVEGPLEQTLESLRAIRHSQCNMIVVGLYKFKWVLFVIYYIILQHITYIIHYFFKFYHRP